MSYAFFLTVKADIFKSFDRPRTLGKASPSFLTYHPQYFVSLDSQSVHK